MMNMKFVLAAIFVFMGCSGLQAAAKAAKKAPEAAQEVSPLGAAWRSALVPGWGQWKRGDKWRSAAYLGCIAGSLGASYFYGAAGNDSYSKYIDAKTAGEASSLYDQTRQQDSMWALFAYTAAGLYALNIADAWFFTKSPAPQALLLPQPGGPTLVALRWKL
jgi:hypothetical protein